MHINYDLVSFYELLKLQRANPNDYGVTRAIEERDAFHDAARHRNTMDWSAAQQRRKVLRDHGLSL